MPRAIWHGIVVAQSEACATAEGCVYFPPNAVETDYLEPNGHRLVCPQKGRAHCFDLVGDDGERARDAAWMYREPKACGVGVMDYIAFRCPPVTIEP